MTRIMPSTSASGAPMSHPPGMTDLLLANIQLQTDLTERLFASMSNGYLPAATSSRHRSQAQTISPGQPQSITEIYAALEIASEEQAVLLEQARKHEEKWNKLQRKKRRVDDLEEKVREILITLQDGRAELEALLDEGKETIKGIDEASSSRITAPQIITYATRLAPFTSHLPALSNTLPLLTGAPPPDPFTESAPTNPHNFVYPVELVIRQGRLAAAAAGGNESGMLGGLGNVGLIGEGLEAGITEAEDGMMVEVEGALPDSVLAPSVFEPTTAQTAHPGLPPERLQTVVPARPFKLGLEDSDDEGD